MKTIVALLVALAVASIGAQAAPKQIMIAPPPPPSPPSGLGPGLAFGFILPTTSLPGSAPVPTIDPATLCQGLINMTSGYPKSAIKCYPGPVGSPAGTFGLGSNITGYLQWQNFPGMTSQDSINAVTSRDQLFYQLSQVGVGALNTTYPGIQVTNACSPKAGAPLPLAPIPIAGVPQATCTVAPIVDASSTEERVGIDTGRYCVGGKPYVIAGERNSSPNLAGPSLADPNVAASLQCVLVSGNTICAAQLGATVDYMMTGQQLRLTFENGVGGECNAESTTAILDFMNRKAARVNAPETPTAGQIAILFETYKVPDCIDSNGDVVLTPFTIYFPAGATMKLEGRWSPLCDSSFAFYKQNSVVGAPDAHPTIGYTCASCSSSTGGLSFFSYNGPNVNKWCSNIAPIAGGVTGTVYEFTKMMEQGTSCVRVGVNDGLAELKLFGKLMLSQNLPYGSEEIVQVFPQVAEYVTKYYPANYQPLAIDTQVNLPCSTPPAIGAPPGDGAVAGVIGTGSCNTKSIFSNGEPGEKAYSGPILILPVTVIGPLAPAPPPPGGVPSPAVASPSPAPVVSPSPAPIPSPSPSPSIPSPTPSPSPKRCVYAGQYRLIPTKSTCGSKSLAFYESCSNTTVVLRTPDQVSSAPNRIHWTLKSTTEGAVATGGLIAAEKSCDSKYLAAPKGQAPKMGGNAWKWQVFFKGNDCNSVVVKSVNSNTYLGVDANCVKVSSTSTAQAFKLKKVA